MDGTEALLRALGKLNAAALAPCAAALVGCLYDGNDGSTEDRVGALRVMEKLDAASLAPHIEWLSRFLTFDWVEDSQDLRDVVLDIFWKLDGDSLAPAQGQVAG